MHDNVFTISFLLAFISIVGSITFYNYSELKSIERNIESAIVKGIDPVAVRCAYTRATDVICVAFAATSSQLSLTATIPTKK